MIAIGLLTLAGLIARALALGFAPQGSYLPDHLDNMAWSDYAVTHGPHRIYDFPDNVGIAVRVRDPRSGAASVIGVPVPHRCNYPPASAYIFWLQGALWHALDSDVVRAPVPPAFRGRLGVEAVESRVIDTPTARFVQALPSMVFDVALAIAVAAVVGALAPRGSAGTRRIAAYGLTLLAPPVFLDSAFWNQTDSWIATLHVATLWALLVRRYTLAGALFGLALVIKPQAILLVPVLGYIGLALGCGGDRRGAAVALGKSSAAALGAVLLTTLPFMIADAGDPQGPLRWIERSYRDTIGAEAYQRTTFNAFNVWWLHLLAQEPGAGLPGSREPLLSAGPTRSMAGLVALGGTILVGAALALRRYGWTQPGWLVVAYLTMLAAFTLPTGVHERYVYYCIPFLIALGCLDAWRWAAPLAALLLVGTFEMTSFRWVRLNDPLVRSQTGFLAVLTVASLVYSLLIIAWPVRAPRGPARR